MDNNEENFEDLAREYTKEETDKKCPECGGTMSYSPETHGLLCPYCGYTCEIDGTKKAEELNFDEAEKTGNHDWGAEKKYIICKSCGAELIYDSLQIAAKCPYCDSNQVMEEAGAEMLAPGGVCPFNISKNQASGLFSKWLKRKLFCVGKAKKSANPNNFTGIYLPYWTFDCDTDSSYSAQYGKDRTVHTRDGKTHTTTDWYNTRGVYSEFFNDTAICGTNRYDGKLLSKIEPFDTENNLEYKPEYISGFVAEKYSIGIKDAWEKAKEFIKNILKNHITSKIKRDHNADHVSSLRVSTTYENITYKYLMLPIWISSYKYKDKVYSFMVNGQTGKVGGKYPVSPWKVLIAILLGLAVVALLYFLFVHAE